MEPLVCVIRVRSQIRVAAVCAIAAFMARMRLMTLVWVVVKGRSWGVRF